MSSKGLHIAIKEAMKQMGDDIISSPQFVNILSDLSAFNEFPACKVILKDLQQSGDIHKVYDSYQRRGEYCTSDIYKISKSVQNKGKYKREIVSYIFDCFLYAFGARYYVNKPITDAFNAYSDSKSDYKENKSHNLNDQLRNLKQRYLTLLDSLAVKPEDFLNEPAGYYPAMAMNELYLIESKIQILSNALGTNDKDWCKNEFEKKIVEFKSDKHLACHKELARLKSLYINKLGASLILPKNKSIFRKSAHFDSKALEEINSLEIDIKRIYREIGEEYDDWCQQEKTALLARNGVKPQSKKTKILKRVVLPLAVAALPATWGTQYLMYKGDIDAFNSQMVKANSLLEQGNYSAALLAYDKAGDDYNHSFLDKKGDANKAIESLVDKICIESQNLLSENKLSEAKARLDEIPTEVLRDRAELGKKVNAIRESIVNALNKIIDNLTSNISKNGGKLDAEGKKMLEEALLISPDDYWLNFIKGKEK